MAYLLLNLIPPVKQRRSYPTPLSTASALAQATYALRPGQHKQRAERKGRILVAHPHIEERDDLTYVIFPVIQVCRLDGVPEGPVRFRPCVRFQGPRARLHWCRRDNGIGAEISHENACEELRSATVDGRSSLSVNHDLEVAGHRKGDQGVTVFGALLRGKHATRRTKSEREEVFIEQTR